MKLFDYRVYSNFPEPEYIFEQKPLCVTVNWTQIFRVYDFRFRFSFFKKELKENVLFSKERIKNKFYKNQNQESLVLMGFPVFHFVLIMIMVQLISNDVYKNKILDSKLTIHPVIITIETPINPYQQ